MPYGACFTLGEQWNGAHMNEKESPNTSPDSAPDPAREKEGDTSPYGGSAVQSVCYSAAICILHVLPIALHALQTS